MVFGVEEPLQEHHLALIFGQRIDRVLKPCPLIESHGPRHVGSRGQRSMLIDRNVALRY